jgi:hypothetical protein
MPHCLEGRIKPDISGSVKRASPSRPVTRRSRRRGRTAGPVRLLAQIGVTQVVRIERPAVGSRPTVCDPWSLQLGLLYEPDSSAEVADVVHQE